MGKHQIQFSEDITLCTTALGIPGMEHVIKKESLFETDDEDLARSVLKLYGERAKLVGAEEKVAEADKADKPKGK